MNLTVWPILFVTIGFVLLVAEVFIPSGGILGVVALGLITWGVWLAFQGSFAQGAVLLMAVLLLAPAGVALAFHLWPRTPFGRRLILRPPAAEEVTPTHGGHRLDHLIGMRATAVTPLRPSGRVACEGRNYDSLAESGLIPPGTQVLIVGCRSGELIVREAETLANDSRSPTTAGPPVAG